MDTNADPGQSTLRPAIARLVAAMMVADRRLAMEEIDAGNRLDRIGLGPLSALVREELQRATRMPIDVDGACAALHGTGPALIGTVLSVLAGIAASDGTIDDDERRVFGVIAGRLGTGMHQIADHLGAEWRGDGVEATAAAGAPTAAARDDGGNALSALGLGAGADPAEVDAAYLRLVAQYDPSKVAPFGADFVVLAVRKLAALTELYEVARDAARR